MKRSDMILAATAGDTEAGNADAILAAYRRETEKTKGGIPLKGKKILAIAAIAALLTVSVSAAVVLSGFGELFGIRVSSGEVDVLETAGEETDLVWNFTEVWFDEYNLYIGGTITTPEVLEEGDYCIAGYFREHGDSGESYMLNSEVRFHGTDTGVFVLRSGTHTDGEGNAWRPGFGEDEVLLDITIDSFYKRPEEDSFNSYEHAVYPGGRWEFTVSCTRQDSADTITVTGPFTGQPGGIYQGNEEIRVDSVKINAFTMVIEGENLMNDLDGTPYHMWLKMKDGTYMFKRGGMYAGEYDNWISWRDEENGDSRIAVTFYEPVDLTQVQSVVLATRWVTASADIAEYFDTDVFQYHILTDGTAAEQDIGKYEVWQEIVEIPLSDESCTE